MRETIVEMKKVTLKNKYMKTEPAYSYEVGICWFMRTY